ncbi:hypothetical protein [Flavobacterium sp. AG291]|uniref:hypothetical protein n=1 Tax=Flavobacterium sp. AG291 TaxID=2184000 RepID=UPI000E0C1321|nr:hypothetical protein [Flavobacterium sp. AG291]RDI09855.1 hypothetical protein DEU42_109153 [Flavobacterium sp. AG291]
MELRVIEKLLEKYFNAETTIAEEKDLKLYFSSPDVVPHLEQYRPLFGYFSQQEEQKFDKTLPLKTKRHYGRWMSVAASVVLLGGLLTFYNTQPAEEDLGTYDDPEVAFRETQKALQMLSTNVNIGMGSVHQVGKEYEKTTKQIIKEKRKEHHVEQKSKE